MNNEQKIKNIKYFYDWLKDKEKVFKSDKESSELIGSIKSMYEDVFDIQQESEDERIRGAIIDHLKDHNLIEWAAWLEKQGKKSSIRERYDRIKESEWFKKTHEGMSVSDESVKSKQKFKVGDWITNSIETVQITGYDIDYGYQVDYKGSLLHRNTDIIEKEYHLWTIKDAKDGDVLFHSDSASNGIFIFKELLKCGFSVKVICYCDYDSEDGFCLGEHHTCCWADAKILHPATKEQRDILFSKIKEAGYEWHEDKKELKKVAPKFKVGDTIINIHYRWDGKDRIREITDCKYIFDSGNYINIKEQDSWELADKVAPKFKIEKGKWYVCNTSRYTDFIVGKAYYCPKNGMLKPNENEIPRYVARNCFHLWSLQDAKDGDVLSFNDGTSGTLLYKEHTENFGVLSYCRIIRNNFIDKEESGWGSTLLSPATKEQRDLLFSKMKEAGYEFDFEKKEFKKIEQKPIEWNSDDEQNLLICKNALAKYQISDKWDADIISHWLVNRLKFIRPQLKREWSEDDKKIMKALIEVLNSDFEKDTEIYGITVGTIIAWLEKQIRLS